MHVGSLVYLCVLNTTVPGSAAAAPPAPCPQPASDSGTPRSCRWQFFTSPQWPVSHLGHMCSLLPPHSFWHTDRPALCRDGLRPCRTCDLPSSLMLADSNRGCLPLASVTPATPTRGLHLRPTQLLPTPARPARPTLCALPMCTPGTNVHYF